MFVLRPYQQRETENRGSKPASATEACNSQPLGRKPKHSPVYGQVVVEALAGGSGTLFHPLSGNEPVNYLPHVFRSEGSRPRKLDKARSAQSDRSPPRVRLDRLPRAGR